MSWDSVFLHAWDVAKARLDLTGSSRVYLQTCLFRRCAYLPQDFVLSLLIAQKVELRSHLLENVYRAKLGKQPELNLEFSCYQPFGPFKAWILLSFCVHLGSETFQEAVG